LTPEYRALSSDVTFSPANRPPAHCSSEVWLWSVEAIFSSAAVISAMILSSLPAAA
jgi:hypothetical protein